MTARFTTRCIKGLYWQYVLPMLLLLSLMASVQAASNQVTLNLKNVEINALIESVSTITGKNFIVDPRVKAQVSVISSKPMNENEVYEVFLAVLTVHGFAAVPSGPVIKIVPAAGAKQDTIPTVDRPGRDPTDQVVTEVIQVQNVSAAQIVPILRPLIPPQGQLAAYAPTNVLIISDIAGNVERVADIIRRMDRASDEEVEIIPLQHASATEVVRTVTTLEQAKTQAAAGQGAQAGTPARLVADERTNSILLSGDKGSRLRLRALVMHLDTPIQREGNTQVIYLRYAKAKDLAQVLTGVSKKIAEEQQQVAPGQQPQAAAPGRGGGGAAGNLIDIQADEPTNSLVITGPLEAIRALRSVIAQLDTRRAQVLVEAAIAEISSDRSAQLGIQWISAAKNVGIIGFTNFTLGLKLSDAVQTALSIANLSKSTTTTTGTTGTTTGTTSTTTTTGTTTGTTGTTSTTGTIGTLPAGTLSGFQGLNVAGGNLNGSNPFAILLTALAADVDTNLLSTPNLVTLDNEEAEIFVGQNLGLQTGTYSTNSTTGLAGNPFNTFERKDIGLKLTVKPQINEGNAVRLEIEQSVEDIPNPTDQNPLYTKRKIKTKVLVEDGQILVLGGLIKDNLSESIQKVPLLGDIPLLGELFRYRTGDKTKSNLMIFLHPVILRNGLQGTLATNDKYTYIREEQEAARLQRGNSLLSDVKTPVLPSQEEVKQHNTMLDTAPPAKTAPPPQAAPPPPKPAPEPPTSSNHFNQ